MEDIILNVIFLTMFLIIIGCIIYFVYNYAEYKTKVDESVFLTNRYINKVVMIFKDSINSTNRNLDTNIRNVSEKISNVHETLDESINLTNINLLKLDESSTKYKEESKKNFIELNASLTATTGSINAINEKVADYPNFKGSTNDSLKTINERVADINGKVAGLPNFRTTTTDSIRDINGKIADLPDFIISTNTSIGDINGKVADVPHLKTKNGEIIAAVNRNSGNIHTINRKFTNKNKNLNDNLLKFFKFNKGSQDMSNKIFEEIDYGTEATSITLKSNVSMCDANNQKCVNFGILDDKFNVNTSPALNNINITDKSGNTLIKLNTDNSDIFLGGNDINAPLIIKGGEVYVKRLNVVNSDTESQTGLALDNIARRVTTLVA